MKIWTKSPWEKITVSFDCSATIPGGDTISVAAATVYDADGMDVSDDMLSGSAGIDETTVTQRIQAGEDGNDYTCRLRLTTAAGEQIEDTLTIRVRETVDAAGLGTLVELEDVKKWLMLATTDDDDFLERAIRDWSDTVETRLGRKLISQEHADERHNGGKIALLLRNVPVTVITEISVDGAALGSSDYVYSGESGIVRMASGKEFGGGPGSVLVTYTGGYATVPGDIQRAVKQLVALEFYLSGHGRKALAKRSESAGDGSTTYERGPEDQEKIMRALERKYARR